MKNTPVSTAAASGGVTGAGVVIVAWLLSLAHIQVPAEVAAAMMVMLTPILHLIVVRFGLDPAVDPLPQASAQPIPPPV